MNLKISIKLNKIKKKKTLFVPGGQMKHVK